MVRKNDLQDAAKVIAEARTIAAFLTETERGKCGGDVDLAIHRVSMFCGIEEGALRSLRYRWRELRDIKASLLERLRESYEAIYERQRRMAMVEREIDRLSENPKKEPDIGSPEQTQDRQPPKGASRPDTEGSSGALEWC